MIVLPGPIRARRLRVIREEYAKGHGGAKRAARLLDMLPDAVRQFARRNGINCRRKAA